MAELVHSESTKEVVEEAVEEAASSTVARVAFPQDIRGKLALAKAYKGESSFTYHTSLTNVNCFLLLDEGNEHFKKGDFKKAKSCYGKVLAFTRGLPGSTRGMEGMVEMAAKKSSGVESVVTIEEDQQAVELEVIAQTNMATCFLKLDVSSFKIYTNRTYNTLYRFYPNNNSLFMLNKRNLEKLSKKHG